MFEGDDDQSSKLVDSFNDPAVSDLIDNANCVALLLPVKRSGNPFLILLSIPVYQQFHNLVVVFLCAANKNQWACCIVINS